MRGRTAVAERFSRATLDRWIRAYRESGLQGLRPQPRSDVGAVRENGPCSPWSALLPPPSPRPRPCSTASQVLRGLSDLPSSCISGLRPQPSLSVPPCRPPTGGVDGISRFSRMKVPRMRGFLTPRVPCGSR
ncbi:MAG TPA: helix-turn-helix domain-containing protein [Candidatus Dormibacteraeota bacterium]|nr:helix-turn-helix domain-containing protein [Candidatus Dormibacteraeota bacterium]